MQSSFSKAATAYMIILAIIAWSALALQLYILLHNVPGNGLTYLQAVGRFLLFFTILTNLLVAISLTTIVLASQLTWGRFFFKIQFPHRRGTLHFYCRSCIQYCFAQHLGTGWPAKMGG